MGNPICHWELMVTDVEKAKAFYGRVFDWKFTDMGMGGYWFIDAGKEPGGGMMAKPPSAPRCALSQYFLVDSIDDTLAKVAAGGGKTVVTKTEIPGMGHFAMFTDPDGIVVGVFEPMDRA
jgi:predicted enzyme related to lactoylglutathione lyase